MKRAIHCLLALAAAGLAGCETTGPSAPPAAAGGGEAFSGRDFAWSTETGGGSVDGILAYRGAAAHYTCQDVRLIPRTAWSRRRMMILYGSDSQADVLADDVRKRTPEAPSGNYAQFVRQATCDGDNHFTFSRLPDGSWFVITVAIPAGGGDRVAVMRRVDTHGGVRHVTLS